MAVILTLRRIYLSSDSDARNEKLKRSFGRSSFRMTYTPEFLASV